MIVAALVALLAGAPGVPVAPRATGTPASTRNAAPAATPAPPRAAPGTITVPVRGGGTLTVTPQLLPFGLPPVSEPEVLSQYPLPGLDHPIYNRLEAVRLQREAGRLEAAADSMRVVLSAAPHHPILLAEMARVLEARFDWAGVIRLATAERAATHDTLLLAHPYARALERLRRPREAAQVALQSWIVEPVEAEWAFQTVSRLAPSDSRAIRDAMHKAALARPDRVDLVSSAARLDWKLGDETAARRALAGSDRPGFTPPLRWRFADDLLNAQSERDSLGAVDALISMAADPHYDATLRMRAAHRAYNVHQARGTVPAGAPEIEKALRDVPLAQWNAELLLDVARGLRQAGQTSAARRLLQAPELAATAPPPLKLERALNDLRDGPPESSLAALEPLAVVSDEARFRYAEALFFSGQADSALSQYKRVSENPDAEFAGAALERLFLIEDAQPKTALPVIGRLMYMEWRGDAPTTLALAESLYRALPRGPLWARVALMMSDRLDATAQYTAALVPLLALADEQPNDRLAPVARQRAGDIYLLRLKQVPEAIAQYEACLTRYPKAWNSPEVRRRLEALRKGRF